VTRSPKFSQLFKELKEKGFKDFVKTYFWNSSDSNIQLTLAVMLGLFFSVAPIWGYQTALALGLAYVFKLNKIVAVLASQASMGPLIPVAIFLSFKLGGWAMGNSAEMSLSFADINMDFIKLNLFQYVIGSLFLGTVMAVLGGLFTYGVLQVFRKPPL